MAALLLHLLFKNQMTRKGYNKIFSLSMIPEFTVEEGNSER